MRRRLLVLMTAVLLAISAGPGASPSGSKAATTTGWRLVVDDRFDSGGLPRHWTAYSGRYGSGAKNCPTPKHVTVAKGSLRLLLRHETSGDCGPGWYSAGVRLVAQYDSVDQRIAVRFKVRSSGGVTGHRIIPMRWPGTTTVAEPGEEDYCEGSGLRGCTTFLHFDGKQIYHRYAVDLTQWHTMVFVRRNFVVRAWIDHTPVWTYRGNPTTLPATPKHPVLQQECQHDGCPAGTTGSELIAIDWIKVYNPA